jgi:hypothetical protein
MLYYGFRTGADLILENNLSDICPTCENIPWKTIDAVTCTNEKTNPDNYYFFDFDGQKLYIYLIELQKHKQSIVSNKLNTYRF